MLVKGHFQAGGYAVINRRHFVGGLTLVATSHPLFAAPPEELTAMSVEGSIALKRYSPESTGKRPGVVVLHGARGIELKPRAYERYANALTAAGIDAYLIRYYSHADEQVLDKLSTQEEREAYRTDRFDIWADRVSSALTGILERPDSSGRVGLLGFSLGGYVAAAAAARDDRVSALAVLYGGMPNKMVSRVKRLPPLLELHGDADHNVPLAQGEALVKLAKSVGAQAEQVVYPGKDHGFDFSDNDPATTDAIDRVVRFFRSDLQTG
ncbi:MULTISPECIES: dienelactone hydrolase family protein [unclassified Bradyrhizobium]|uniref:dienelactone hydrolase family protein n=1 Tax=unclassified Bradyrhizobium TaxID=2631580 RepID=UPI002916A87E|nr:MULTISPECIES: dienelactone hydrolase family protein [unclassified Bradyrhizobium]